MTMPELAAILLLGLAANLDNFALGAAYGARDRRLRVTHNALISLLNGAGTALMLFTGERIGRLLPEGWAEPLGGAVFVLLGAWAFWDTWRSRPRPLGTETAAAEPHFFCPEPTPVELAPSPRPVGWREAWALGLSLTLTNLGAGVGAGMAGLPPTATVAAMILASAGMLEVGWRVGRLLHSFMPLHWAGLAAGALLFALGLWRMV